MNAEQLLQHYERIADAADAVARLRRFILDLAVRGKLVPQDLNDEPASDLLKRIAKEKARLVKAGEIKRDKLLESPSVGDLDIDLPTRWSVACLSDIAVCLDYRRVPINGTEREARIKGKPQEILFPYYGATQQQGWIDDYLFDGEFVLLGEDGVPFHDPLRAKAYLVTGKSWVNNHAHVFQAILTSPRFLVHYLNVFDYAGRVVGATRSKLNQAQAVTIPVPLPPLAEQGRIVAKVDELMALCDRLEIARAGREATRDRLSTASLARLNTPDPDPAVFARDARFTLDNLAALTARPDQIKQLRQTILNLAVRGKLVTQDPKEVASLPASKALAFEEPFVIPPNWTWTAFGSVVELENGDRSKNYPNRHECVDKGVAWINTGHILPGGSLSLQHMHYISRKKFDSLGGGKIRPNDLVYCLRGATFGKTAFVDPFIEGAIASSLMIIRPGSNIDRRFTFLFLTSPFGRQQLLRFDNGTAQPNLSSANVKKYFVPLPPLAEQRRIVASVDQLMSLCDRLEASLTEGATARRRLLEALLAQALALKSENIQQEAAQ